MNGASWAAVIILGVIVLIAIIVGVYMLVRKPHPIIVVDRKAQNAQVVGSRRSLTPVGSARSSGSTPSYRVSKGVPA